MTSIPQLRVRTEFSFRAAFGPIQRVADAVAAIGAPAAGIVDPGTWGHVRWAKAAKKAGFKPLFGAELPIPQPDGRKPTAWCLASDTRMFYRFSTAIRATDADPLAIFKESAGRGVIRFAGAALSDPDAFDYIDLNPASPLQQARALRLHTATGKPLVVTSDNGYPLLSDKGPFMALGGRENVTPQHLLSVDELRAAIPGLSAAQFDRAVEAAFTIADQCAGELPTAPIIRVDGDLRALAEAGRVSRLERGHLASWPKEYADRLERELLAIEEKEFQSYFIVVADLIAWAKERMLVGPGRGSSAGSLLCYLIGITEVDPIPFGLLFERFIDFTRKDLPDIDIDFSDTKREQCFTYLSDKYGRDNVARLGNINTLKPKSVMAKVCERFGIPDGERFALVNVLEEHSSGSSLYGKSLEQALNHTDTGKAFMARHPTSAVMTEIENHASHTGVHAAGVIVCNVPVSDYCTLGPDGVAQIDKPDSEALNLLKIDALGLRTLGVIEDAGVTTNEELYALKLNDPEVFRVFNDQKFCGIFQFEGQAQRSVSCQVDIQSFESVDHITALARPGPLGGGAAQKYIERKAGRAKIEASHPAMAAMLADTYGVVLYQEQVMRIVREIGKFSWADTTVIRKAMSGRKGKEFFDQQGEKFFEGAAQDGIDRPAAQAIWNEICNFGAWGMNKSHTCAYAVISYWCGWMKMKFPLEYAAACLRSAKDDDQTIAILREMAEEGVEYEPFNIETSDENWSVQNGRLVGGFLNLVGIGPSKAKAAIEARAAGKLTDAARAKILAAEVKFSDLNPLYTAWRHIYLDPQAHGCREGSRIVTADDFPEEGDLLWIARVTEKKPRDINESVLVAKRGGKRYSGPTAFADFRLVDDTGTPILARIDRYDFERIGRKAVEELRPGEDVVMVRAKRIRNFSMINIQRIKCLNRPEALE